MLGVQIRIKELETQANMMMEPKVKQKQKFEQTE